MCDKIDGLQIHRNSQKVSKSVKMVFVFRFYSSYYSLARQIYCIIQILTRKQNHYMMNHFIYISTKIRIRIRIRMWTRMRIKMRIRMRIRMWTRARRGTDMKLINSFKHDIVRNGSSK